MLGNGRPNQESFEEMTKPCACPRTLNNNLELKDLNIPIQKEPGNTSKRQSFYIYWVQS